MTKIAWAALQQLVLKQLTGNGKLRWFKLTLIVLPGRRDQETAAARDTGDSEAGQQ